MLHDIEMLLPTGSFNLLVGPNGSGKTTLLRLASTFALPTQGRIHWGQADGTETLDARKARPRIGYAGHTPLLYDELTTYEHLEFALRIRGHTTAGARDGAETWLRTFELHHRYDERAETLSRGLRQRLALAQAFAPRPDFLLLDEP
ncbi:MAG TPA: ABC transporter ATP-binding protein, partial [Candidatus Thermoplasmatota archaeon]|nr:ABC transporter ATP-binding protein [Candidatus Thermoplasmatota archaeon]